MENILIAIVVAVIAPAVMAIVGHFIKRSEREEERRERRQLVETVATIKTQTDGLTSALIKTEQEKNVMTVDAATLAAREAERERGAKEAETLERGRRQGMEAAVAQTVGPSVAPLPVTDKAATRVAEATEQLARAAQKTADKP